MPENGGENANQTAQRAARRESAVEPLTLQSGGEVSTLVGVATGAKIRGTVFQDADYNGQLDKKEKRISGVQVQAVDENGAIAATTTTNADGKYALDGLWKLSFGPALYICCGVIAALLVVLMLTKRLNAKKGGISIGILAAACLLYQIPAVASLFSMVTVPMVTFLVVGLLCLFNVGIMKTRIGQQFRAVGQNRTVANASGIHVDHVRVIAIMISTVLAGWGQLIFVQNMGTFQTYGAHEQVGLYAGAAILVGGASIRRATNGQALLGCILFLLTLLLSIAVEMISARRPKTM